MKFLDDDIFIFIKYMHTKTKNHIRPFFVRMSTTKRVKFPELEKGANTTLQ